MFENEQHAEHAFNKINELDPLCFTTCLDKNNNVSLYFHNDNNIVYGFMHGWTTQYPDGIDNVYISTCFIRFGYYDQDGQPLPTTHGALVASKYTHSKLEDFDLLKP